MPDLTSEIEAQAALPLKSATDGQSAEGHTLQDLIAADKYLKGLEQTEGTNPTGGPKSPWRGLRMARAIPPGSV